MRLRVKEKSLWHKEYDTCMVLHLYFQKECLLQEIPIPVWCLIGQVCHAL